VAGFRKAQIRTSPGKAPQIYADAYWAVTQAVVYPIKGTVIETWCAWPDEATFQKYKDGLAAGQSIVELTKQGLGSVGSPKTVEVSSAAYDAGLAAGRVAAKADAFFAGAVEV
jgi:hypothetical protein